MSLSSSFIMGEGGGAGESGTCGSAGVSAVRRHFLEEVDAF